MKQLTTHSLAPEPRRLTYVAAIREGLHQAMEEDPDVFLIGEDVGGAGGVFGTYKGLLEHFGNRRVVDSPISEAGIVGLGVGAAAVGLRPIVDIMFMDFLGECMDEVANQMAKMRYMFGGKARLSMTVTTMAGAGMSAAAQHSQSLEAWLVHLPGLKVVMPSTPYDAKGLIIAAVRDPNPVFVVLNKMSLAHTGVVPEEPYEVPLGVSSVVRTGRDLTLVATGRMVSEAMVAADRLQGEGVSVEIVDPRSLQPLDMGTILDSVAKTHRAVVVEEAVRFAGFGAEVSAQIAERAFSDLDAPIGRLGAPFAPVPFSPALEEHYVPNARAIEAEVRRVLDNADAL